MTSSTPLGLLLTCLLLTSAGKIQFFVRPAVGSNVIDYLVFDFALVPGNALNNQTINGTFFGLNVTFTVSFDLACVHNSYGPNCIYCLATDSDDSGHYTCLDDGSKQCLPGYVNASSDCTTPCEPAAGCENGYCNVPGECICLPDYGGDLCEQDMDVCGHTSPCQSEELCTSTGPDSHNCTPIEPTEPTGTPTASEHPQDASGSSITVVVIVTVTVLTVAVVVAVIVISVCVYLLRKRKNKHCNTTDNITYHNSSGPDMMKINEVYTEISDPSITTSTNDAYGITHQTNDVLTSQNEAYGVIRLPSSGSGVRMNLNEAYSSVNVPSQN